ncbi:hypothetical protein CUC15_16550 [Oceanobacillus zhaokaii]|uniref:Uncharacterized protein n=1 Tax=Oceanobacillus zhaokaii TaxID=2052660 RepID=A0A345PKB3_9BACI|nr:hypothetical protein CUC15_16550 [Oceanobacillus zhaokaii]
MAKENHISIPAHILSTLERTTNGIWRFTSLNLIMVLIKKWSCFQDLMEIQSLTFIKKCD